MLLTLELEEEASQGWSVRPSRPDVRTMKTRHPQQAPKPSQSVPHQRVAAVDPAGTDEVAEDAEPVWDAEPVDSCRVQRLERLTT